MRREDGFTLPELLVVIVLLGIVIGAIGASIIVGLRTTDDTNRRLTESHDAQIATAYFVSDVQSADDVSLTDTACAGIAPVVRLQWTDPTDGKVMISSYAVPAATTELHRYYCENGGLVSDVVAVHKLGATAPSAVCSPAPNCPGTPDKVTLTVTEESGYAYDLVGFRRATG